METTEIWENTTELFSTTENLGRDIEIIPEGRANVTVSISFLLISLLFLFFFFLKFTILGSSKVWIFMIKRAYLNK